VGSSSARVRRIFGVPIALSSRPVRWLVTTLSVGQLALAGCYAPTPIDGVPCAPGGGCPQGQQCGVDDRCWTSGAGPDASAGSIDASAGVADAASGARDAAGTADAAPACAYACSIDVAAGTSDCSGPVVPELTPERGRAQLDLGAYTSLALTFEACSPTGWSLHLADSPSCSGYGGDAGDSSNDAEIQLLDTTIGAYGSDYGVGLIGSLADAVVAGACSTSTWVVADAAFAVADTAFELASPYLLRIDPPMDDEGTPDALWYLGLNRTYGSLGRVGTGLTTVEICLR
jgi:hypothetical protein